MERTFIIAIRMVLLIAGTALLTAGCKKDGPVGAAPVLSVPELIEISNISATIGSHISAGDNITARGVCWSTTPEPTTEDDKTTDGSGAGSFTSEITGLSADTEYYVRSYATNRKGTVYGSQESFTTLANGALGSGYVSIADIEGNVYSIVTIGTQTWMAENLRTGTYNDGAAIPNITNNTTWEGLTYGAYSLYGNTPEPGFNSTYGKLYNWHAVNTSKLCPAGWHIPTDEEWTTLVNYLGREVVAGGKMKQTFTGLFFWKAPNTEATNESGFSGLPGGRRLNNGVFDYLRDYGFWWSSTEDFTLAWSYYLFYNSSKVFRNAYHKRTGLSCRCVKD